MEMNECSTTFTGQLQAQSNGHQKVGSLDLAEGVLSRESTKYVVDMQACMQLCELFIYFSLGGGGRGEGGVGATPGWVGGVQ